MFRTTGGVAADLLILLGQIRMRDQWTAGLVQRRFFDDVAGCVRCFEDVPWSRNALGSSAPVPVSVPTALSAVSGRGKPRLRRFSLCACWQHNSVEISRGGSHGPSLHEGSCDSDSAVR